MFSNDAGLNYFCVCLVVDVSGPKIENNINKKADINDTLNNCQRKIIIQSYFVSKGNVERDRNTIPQG